MDPKSFVVPGLLVVAAIFGIASAATDWAIFGSTRYGIIDLCTASYCVQQDACSTRNDTRHAAAAFVIMADIFIGIAAILALVRIFAAALKAGPAKMVVIVLAAVSVLCFFLAWVLGFALWDGKFCGVRVKDFGGGKVGPMAPLSLVAFVVAIVGVVCEFIFDNPFAGGAVAAQ